MLDFIVEFIFLKDHVVKFCISSALCQLQCLFVRHGSIRPDEKLLFKVCSLYVCMEWDRGWILMSNKPCDFNCSAVPSSKIMLTLRGLMKKLGH